MIKDTVAIVPARSGSKGFPGKNLKKIGKYSLLELACLLGNDCSFVGETIVSTDSLEYEEIAKNAGAISFGLRPTELAEDGSKTFDVILDLLNRYPSLKEKYKYILLLQPTCPTRTLEDINNCKQIFESEGVDAIVSVEQIDEPHPLKLKKIDDTGFIIPFIEGGNSEQPRQKLTKAYSLTGGIYLIKIDALIKEKTFLPKNTIPYVSNKSVNIDTEDDYEWLKYLVKLKKILGHKLF